MAPNYREVCFEQWGKACSACGVSVGIEAHHIDENHENNVVDNLMPLCGTCHNLVTGGMIQIAPASREITLNVMGLFEAGPLVPPPPHQVQLQLKRFKDVIGKAVWEVAAGRPFCLLHDAVSGAYFVECHVTAEELHTAFDFDAVLNPQDPDDPASEDYRLNREIILFNASYRKMQKDAEAGRPFSDIIVEFNTDYRDAEPLKVLGGQHRGQAIKDAVSAGKETGRLHGLRVFLGLTKEQRAEISLTSNTNIAIAKALIDRFQEQQMGPESRGWAQEARLLEAGQDFADRVSGQERFTVQMLRALVINYIRGLGLGTAVEGRANPEVYLPKTGALDPDPAYKAALDVEPTIWEMDAFKEAGRQFAALNERQIETCSAATGIHQDLRKVESRYKTLTPTMAAAWAFVAGALQADGAGLGRHYQLPKSHDPAVSPDPLNAKQMSVTRHEIQDPPTYRGLGTRQTSAEAQRLVEVFLLQSSEDMTGSLTPELLSAGVGRYFTKKQQQENEEQKQAAIQAAQHVQGAQGPA